MKGLVVGDLKIAPPIILSSILSLDALCGEEKICLLKIEGVRRDWQSIDSWAGDGSKDW